MEVRSSKIVQEIGAVNKRPTRRIAAISEYISLLP
jgi:hypothetical protein